MKFILIRFFFYIQRHKRHNSWTFVVESSYVDVVCVSVCSNFKSNIWMMLYVQILLRWWSWGKMIDFGSDNQIMTLHCSKNKLIGCWFIVLHVYFYFIFFISAANEIKRAETELLWTSLCGLIYLRVREERGSSSSVTVYKVKLICTSACWRIDGGRCSCHLWIRLWNWFFFRQV